MSLVSICLTTHNRAHSLSLTIDSILAQNFKDFELIINDDNSSDSTELICNKYCKSDKRVTYHRNASNLKMPGNLNSAIAKGKAEFIANLHDGDIYKPELIERWIEKLNSNPSALFVFNQYNAFNSKGKFITTYKHPFGDVSNGSALLEYSLKTFSSAPWGTVMVRKNAYQKYGMFNSDFGFISDVEMWLRLGLHGDVAYVNEPLIDLTPREKTHPYFYPDWKIFCLNAYIIISYYKKYVDSGKFSPSDNLLRMFIKKFEKRAIMDLMLLVKIGNWKKVREGLYVFSTLPIKKLNNIRKLFPFITLKEPDYKGDVTNLIKAFASLPSMNSFEL